MPRLSLLLVLSLLLSLTLAAPPVQATEDDDEEADAEDDDDGEFEDEGDVDGWEESTEPALEEDGGWIPPRAHSRKIPKWAHSRTRVRLERDLGFGVGALFLALGAGNFIGAGAALQSDEDFGNLPTYGLALAPVFVAGGVALMIVGADMIALDRIMELRGFTRCDPRERARVRWALRWGPPPAHF